MAIDHGTETGNGLTIVIPAYRCARYLSATVRSALACGGAQIIISEDAGGDDTLAVARQMRDQNPERITLIENPKNLGMTGNWRSAFGRVGTPWVLKLDGDDLINPAYVAAAMAFVRTRPDIGVLAGRIENIGADDYLEAAPAASGPVPAEAFDTFEGVAALQLCLRWLPVPCSSSMIFRMAVYRQVGGFDALLGDWGPDREIWFRISRVAPVAMCNRPAVYYRTLPTSITAATGRADRQCYGYSRMLHIAAEQWHEPEARKLLRLAFIHASGSFVKSAWRAVRRGRAEEVPGRIAHGAADLYRAVAPRRQHDFNGCQS
ncbi:MAG: glycosyltransferase family 2 protein [Phycisphaerae bacterium]